MNVELGPKYASKNDSSTSKKNKLSPLRFPSESNPGDYIFFLTVKICGKVIGVIALPIHLVATCQLQVLFGES